MTASRPAGKREARLRTREEFGGQGEHGRTHSMNESVMLMMIGQP
jgi:hypothetical protein